MDSSSQSAISLNIFIDQANSEFEKIVTKFPEPRSLAFPSRLTNFVLRLLRTDVTNRYMERKAPLEAISKSDNQYTLFFITPGDTKSLNEICATFEKIPNYTKVLLIIPRYTLMCQQILANYGYSAVQSEKIKYTNSEVAVFDFHADFLPIEDYCFLMPSYRTFLQLHVDHDYSEIYNCGRALAKIQTIFGRIPQIFTLGPNAERVKNVMNEMNETANTLRTATPQIDTLIIIDRIADMVTPLLTQTTLEGVVDNIYGVEYGICVPPEGTVAEKSILFTDKNYIMSKTRTLPMSMAADLMTKMCKEIDSTIKSMNTATGASKNEILAKAGNNLDKQIGFQKQLNLLNAANISTSKKYPATKDIVVKEFMLIKGDYSIVPLAENLITLFNDWQSALRLLCLQSVAGLTHSKKTVSLIQKELCSQFGLQIQPMLVALDRLRLVSTNPFFLKWSSLVKELDLFPQGEDPAKEPLDGYVPPSIRVVQNAVNGRWAKVQKAYDENIIAMSASGQPSEHIAGEKTRILVFFVGGVTVTEIGILRKISKSAKNAEVIIGATDKINGNQLIESLIPPIASHLK